MGINEQTFSEKECVMEKINLMQKIGPTRSEKEIRKEFNTLIEKIE